MLGFALLWREHSGVPYPKGTLGGNCAVVCESLAPSSFWSRCGGFASPGRTVWRVQSGIVYLAPLSRTLPDQRM